MTYCAQIAKHLREIYFGGNWTTSSLKMHVNDLTWQEATKKVGPFNTIVALVYHVNYYVNAVSLMLEGKPFNAKDKYSFDHPPIESQDDWEQLLNKVWEDAESFATLIEQFPDDKLEQDFIDKKYGNYFRNFHGIIEHMHYHLGQIVLIKQLIAQQTIQ